MLLIIGFIGLNYAEIIFGAVHFLNQTFSLVFASGFHIFSPDFSDDVADKRTVRKIRENSIFGFTFKPAG